MMAMVEEAAIEMGSTGGSVGANLNTSSGSVIVTDNMPEDLATETEEERWRIVAMWMWLTRMDKGRRTGEFNYIRIRVIKSPPVVIHGLSFI